MNELIKIENSVIGSEQIQTVNARGLHGFLEVKSEFRNWIKNRINEFGFIENEDFITTVKFYRGGEAKNYHISLDMAKELSMVERNEKGKHARQYFIECERRLRDTHPIPQTLPEALRLAADLAEKIEHQEQIIEEAQPAIGFYDAVGDSTSLTSVGDAAKSLGFGRNHFFKWLRSKEFLMKDYNTPYQKWIEAKYFQVKYQSYVDEFGEIKHRPVTFITGKGLQYLLKQLGT